MLISNFIVFGEKVLYSFSLFKLLKLVHYLGYGLSLKWNHIFSKRICILLSVYSVLSYIIDGTIQFYNLLNFCLKFFFYQLLKEVLKSPIITVELSVFFFQLWQFLLQPFWGFVVNCCIFLMNWPLYETSFFGSTNVSHLKVYFVSYYHNLLSSIMSIVFMAYIWSSFHFWSASLSLNGVSCGQYRVGPSLSFWSSPPFKWRV